MHLHMEQAVAGRRHALEGPQAGLTEILATLQIPFNGSTRQDWESILNLWTRCAEKAVEDSPGVVVSRRLSWKPRRRVHASIANTAAKEDYEGRYWDDVIDVLRSGASVFKLDPDAILLRSPVERLRRSGADIVACPDCAFELDARETARRRHIHGSNYKGSTLCQSGWQLQGSARTFKEDWQRTGFHLCTGSAYFRPTQRVIRLLEEARAWQSRSTRFIGRVANEQLVLLQTLGVHNCTWSTPAGVPLSPAHASLRLFRSLEGSTSALAEHLLSEEEDRERYSIVGSCDDGLRVEVLSYGLCPRTPLEKLNMRWVKDTPSRKREQRGPIVFHPGGSLASKTHRLRDVLKPLWETIGCGAWLQQVGVTNHAISP